MIQAPAAQNQRPTPTVMRHGIAVASGKGGVGKTWLAATLAHCFARSARRVLLFDGDLGLANVDIQLGLAPKYDLGGVLTGQYELATAATAYRDTSLDVIAGHSGMAKLASLPITKVNELCNQLVRLAVGYDRVILDLGAGIEKTVLRFAQCAATKLVVTTDEPTALTDAYAFTKVALQQDRKADIRFVVNMANSAGEGQRAYALLNRACQNFLKASPPLAGVIRRDIRVREAIRHQAPLLIRHPNCAAASDVERLAQSLLGPW
jgi:flagellar biosynthesis protein FlhG